MLGFLVQDDDMLENEDYSDAVIFETIKLPSHVFKAGVFIMSNYKNKPPSYLRTAAF